MEDLINREEQRFSTIVESGVSDTIAPAVSPTPVVTPEPIPSPY